MFFFFTDEARRGQMFAAAMMDALMGPDAQYHTYHGVANNGGPALATLSRLRKAVTDPKPMGRPRETLLMKINEYLGKDDHWAQRIWDDPTIYERETGRQLLPDSERDTGRSNRVSPPLPRSKDAVREDSSSGDGDVNALLSVIDDLQRQLSAMASTVAQLREEVVKLQG